mmetsp:Transcript_89077/g.238536  ORF Transcript_89077/g.238536 Transcript_89077/m.238536 type:complete len:681 (-) Transcript_89077:264-2306(-)
MKPAKRSGALVASAVEVVREVTEASVHVDDVPGFTFVVVAPEDQWRLSSIATTLDAIGVVRGIDTTLLRTHGLAVVTFFTALDKEGVEKLTAAFDAEPIPISIEDCLAIRKLSSCVSLGPAGGCSLMEGLNTAMKHGECLGVRVNGGSTVVDFKDMRNAFQFARAQVGDGRTGAVPPAEPAPPGITGPGTAAAPMPAVSSQFSPPPDPQHSRGPVDPRSTFQAPVRSAFSPPNNARSRSVSQTTPRSTGQNPLDSEGSQSAVGGSFDDAGEGRAMSTSGVSQEGRTPTEAEAKENTLRIDLGAVESGADRRTTLMMRNIPNLATNSDVMALVDQVVKGQYSSLFLPEDRTNGGNMGFGFIKFTEPASIIPFMHTLNGKKWCEVPKFQSSDLALEIRYSRYQATKKLLKKWGCTDAMEGQLPPGVPPRDQGWYQSSRSDTGAGENTGGWRDRPRGDDARVGSWLRSPPGLSVAASDAPPVRPAKDPSASRYAIDLNAVLSGADWRTTLMVKNIPNRMSQERLGEIFDRVVQGRYNCLILPLDPNRGYNTGFAFINFMDCQSIIPFYQAFHGRPWSSTEDHKGSTKVIELRYSSCQGTSKLLKRWGPSSGDGGRDGGSQAGHSAHGSSDMEGLPMFDSDMSASESGLSAGCRSAPAGVSVWGAPPPRAPSAVGGQIDYDPFA